MSIFVFQRHFSDTLLVVWLNVFGWEKLTVENYFLFTCRVLVSRLWSEVISGVPQVNTQLPLVIYFEQVSSAGSWEWSRLIPGGPLQLVVFKRAGPRGSLPVWRSVCIATDDDLLLRSPWTLMQSALWRRLHHQVSSVNRSTWLHQQHSENTAKQSLTSALNTTHQQQQSNSWTHTSHWMFTFQVVPQSIKTMNKDSWNMY